MKTVKKLLKLAKETTLKQWAIYLAWVTAVLVVSVWEGLSHIYSSPLLAALIGISVVTFFAVSERGGLK